MEPILDQFDSLLLESAVKRQKVLIPSLNYNSILPNHHVLPKMTSLETSASCESQSHYQLTNQAESAKLAQSSVTQDRIDAGSSALYVAPTWGSVGETSTSAHEIIG